MPTEGVVADANVLLSAVVGKAALRVFTEFDVVVHVAQFNTDEVAEYLPRMASKYELPVELVEMQWKLLPFRIHPVWKRESRCILSGDITHRAATRARKAETSWRSRNLPHQHQRPAGPGST